MARTSGMPVGSDVRERLRAAQRAETEAIAAVQAAQAFLVCTSGLERAAALLDVSSKVLRSAVKETAQDASAQATTINTRTSAAPACARLLRS